MKKYIFLFYDENKSQQCCLCEKSIEACGMYEAFTKVQQVANDFAKDTEHSIKIELKEVQYFDEYEFVDAL